MTKAFSYTLGRVYGYERGYPSLLPFQREVADRIHDAIQQCFDNYAIMFNTTSSLCFFSYVLGEDLANMGMANNMGDNFPTIIKMAKLDEPLYTNILSQAHKVAVDNFSEEHISLFKKGKQPAPIWHDGTGPFILPQNCVELLSVSIGDHNEYYLCCNLFHPTWALKNKLPMWIAFEINTLNGKSTPPRRAGKIFRGTQQPAIPRFSGWNRNQNLGEKLQTSRHIQSTVKQHTQESEIFPPG